MKGWVEVGRIGDFSELSRDGQETEKWCYGKLAGGKTVSTPAFNTIYFIGAITRQSGPPPRRSCCHACCLPSLVNGVARARCVAQHLCLPL